MLTKGKLIRDIFGGIVLLILDECMYLMMDGCINTAQYG